MDNGFCTATHLILKTRGHQPRLLGVEYATQNHLNHRSPAPDEELKDALNLKG